MAKRAPKATKSEVQITHSGPVSEETSELTAEVAPAIATPESDATPIVQKALEKSRAKATEPLTVADARELGLGRIRDLLKQADDEMKALGGERLERARVKLGEVVGAVR